MFSDIYCYTPLIVLQANLRAKCGMENNNYNDNGLYVDGTVHSTRTPLMFCDNYAELCELCYVGINCSILHLET